MAQDEQLPNSQIAPIGAQSLDSISSTAASLISDVPWLREAVMSVSGNLPIVRKLDRVKEVLTGIGQDLRGFEGNASRDYVKTEDFQEVLEKTLKQVAEERNQDKQRIYKDFLVGVIKSPGQPYDEQIVVLRQLQEVQPDHIRILKAMMRPPKQTNVMAGSRKQTLNSRLSSYPIANIDDLIGELNSLRLTDATGLTTLVTGPSTEDLRFMVTSPGRKFLRYITGE